MRKLTGKKSDCRELKRNCNITHAQHVNVEQFLSKYLSKFVASSSSEFFRKDVPLHHFLFCVTIRFLHTWHLGQLTKFYQVHRSWRKQTEISR